GSPSLDCNGHSKPPCVRVGGRSRSTSASTSAVLRQAASAKYEFEMGSQGRVFGALGNSASAGGRVGVESFDVKRGLLGLATGSWHPQLEHALAERDTDDAVLLRLADRAGRRAAARDGGPARPRAGRFEERRGLAVRVLDQGSSSRWLQLPRWSRSSVAAASGIAPIRVAGNYLFPSTGGGLPSPDHAP